MREDTGGGSVFIVMPTRNTKETFIEKATKVHGNYYDYSKVVYVNSKTKVCIICPKHGEFWQIPNNHLNGNGCPSCANEKNKDVMRSNTYEFLNKLKKVLSEDEYDFSKVDYYNNRKKVLVICKKHGEFYAKPADLLHGHGCPICRYIKAHDKTRKSTEQFISDARKVHGSKYDYSKTAYKGAHEKVIITCPEHGDFEQEPNVHLKGYGCPKCSESHLEKEIRALLEENNIKYDYEKQFPWLKNIQPMSIDFYLPELNVGIECQGRQHFEPIEWFGGEVGFEACLERDNLKNKLCSENSIKIVYYTKETSIEKENIYTDKNTFYTQNDLLRFLTKNFV